MAKDEKSSKEAKIIIKKDGPYLVSGNLPMAKEIIVCDDKGNSVEWKKGKEYPKQETCGLCRCGQSKNKPFCDGTHIKIAFKGTETASRKKYADQAEKISGPYLELADVPELCARARFCHNKDGNVWDLTENSESPKSKEIATKQACNCPAGRLVVCDKKTGRIIEPRLEKSISFIEDPPKKVSGPIWVKGGVKIESADGTQYETRNRVTLCRCGKSHNKPFCDGCHIDNKFNDGDESLA